MFLIYKITNKLNNKNYIGKTSRDLKVRWREHTSKARQITGYYLHNSIKKHGEKNFTIQEIARAETEEEANALEKEWINYYHTNKKEYGYNLTKGGDGIKKYDWGIFRKLWDEGYSVKEIASIIGCYRGTVGEALKDYPNYSYRKSLQRSSYSRKPINKYDKNKNLLRTYPSILEAAEDLGASPSTISKCIRNKKYSCLGYFWSYEGEELPKDSKFIKTNKKTPINQYSLNGTFIKTFESSAAAAREVNPSGNVNATSSCILQVCKGNQETAYGYKWKRRGVNG